MATIYAAPIPAPDMDSVPGEDFRARWDRYDAECEAYIKQVQELALTTGTHGGKVVPDVDLIGKVVRFQYADGYAQYVIWNTKPLHLVHLAVGDAWDLPAWQSRGIRLADVKAHVARDAIRTV